jgi:hypothetical protein
MRDHVPQEEIPVDAPVDLFASLRSKKVHSRIAYQREGCFAFVAALLTLLTGCVNVHFDSNTTVDDKLLSLQTLQPGDVLVVYGENAPPREEAISDYFSAFCLQAYGKRDIIAYLIATILRLNPQPGRFSVKHLAEVYGGLATASDDDSDCVEGSILCKLGLSKAKVLTDHLHYAIHVREVFQPKIHVPLYAFPAGIASCGHKTILEADVWELPTDRYIGSFSVSAEGELTVVAYFYHLIIECDTQKDAAEKLAHEIIERFTGLKPLEVD